MQQHCQQLYIAEDLTNDNFTVEESRLLIFFPLREIYLYKQSPEYICPLYYFLENVKQQFPRFFSF